jgi:hypothetical protein
MAHSMTQHMLDAGSYACEKPYNRMRKLHNTTLLYHALSRQPDMKHDDININHVLPMT